MGLRQRLEKAEEEDEFIPTYVQARKLFNEHEVVTDVELKWKPCQAEELTIRAATDFDNFYAAAEALPSPDEHSLLVLSVELLAKSQLGDGFMASPAVVGNELILRSKSHLYCVTER